MERFGRGRVKEMKRRLILCALFTLVLLACEKKPDPVQEKPEVQTVPKVVIERERKEREPPLPPEVKIKLKRDGKENYTWELSGSDADQILKVNEKIRKQLDKK